MEARAGVVGGVLEYTYGSTAPDGLMSLVGETPREALCCFRRHRMNSEIPAIKVADIADISPLTRPAMRGVDNDLDAFAPALAVNVSSSKV